MGGELYNATRAEQQLAALNGHAARAEDAARLSPAFSGLITGSASMVAGMLPLAPFAFLPISSAIVVSMILSLGGLLALGSVTGRVAGGTWLTEGLRLVAVAGIAALAAAVVGATLQVA